MSCRSGPRGRRSRPSGDPATPTALEINTFSRAGCVLPWVNDRLIEGAGTNVVATKDAFAPNCGPRLVARPAIDQPRTWQPPDPGAADAVAPDARVRSLGECRTHY